MFATRWIPVLVLCPMLLLGCDSANVDDSIDLAPLRSLFECNSLSSISVGATVTGSLSTNDCLAEDGTFADYYAFRLTSSQTIRIDLESNAFDAFLWLYAANGTLIATDDDGGTDLNARLVQSLNAGVYVISAASFDVGETGSYTLRLRTQ